MWRWCSFSTPLSIRTFARRTGLPLRAAFLIDSFTETASYDFADIPPGALFAWYRASSHDWYWVGLEYPWYRVRCPRPLFALSEAHADRLLLQASVFPAAG